MSLDPLMHPDAPWRARTSIPLTDAVEIAGAHGVDARVCSTQRTETVPAVVSIQGTSPPDFVSLALPAHAAVGAPGPGLEVGDDTREVVLSLPTHTLVLSLVLTKADAREALPLITGDHAAVAAFGWDEQSGGREAEVRVSGALLLDALRRLQAPSADTRATSAMIPPAATSIPSAFNLFHSFATKEVTHSGMWAWIIKSLDAACPPEYHELRPVARALLAVLGVDDIGDSLEVRREVDVGKAGRVDIQVRYGEHRVLVLEMKVRARPDAEQRARYAAAYRAQGFELSTVAILSTRYDAPWGADAEPYAGPARLLDALRAGPCGLDLMRQYRDWLTGFTSALREDCDAVFDAGGADAARALTRDDVQWTTMHRIGRAIGGPSHVDLYAGTSIGGAHWTQLAFSGEASPDHDALFYRLESTGDVARFTLRQYSRSKSPAKVERLHLLRRLFSEALTESGHSTLFDLQPRGVRTAGYEVSIAQLRSASPDAFSTLLHALPDVHGRFTKLLEGAGWPLGSARPLPSAPRT